TRNGGGALPIPASSAGSVRCSGLTHIPISSTTPSIRTRMTRSGPTPTTTSMTACSANAVGYGGTYASVGPSGQGGDYARAGAPHGRSAARGVAGGRSVEADLCSGQTAGLTDWPIEPISQTVEPNDQQRAILGELRDATAKALDQLKAACPTALPSTP